MKLFAFISIWMLGCSTLWAQQTPARITREVKTNQSVLLTQYPDGTLNSTLNDSVGMLLFIYQYTAAQQEGTADDEYTEQIAFTVKPDKSGKFVLRNKQLEAAQAFFYKGCFCADRGTFAITSGAIKGTRLSKTEWYVDMKLTLQTGRGNNTQTVTKKMKGRYTIVNSN